MILTADRVALPAGLVGPGWAATSGDRVTGAGAGMPSAPADRHLTGLLVPGFVDQHCHGGGGASFTTGDRAEAERVIATHRAHGTTTMVASLVTDTEERLVASLRALAPLVRTGELAGLHLEGPWLSPGRCGAHDPTLLRVPEPAAVARLLDAGEDAVRMVTLATELDHGLDAVALLAGREVVVALGHTDATYADTLAAIGAGVTVATHLFNTMPPVHHREPGPVLALTADERVVVELVADGIHLHPEVLRRAAASAPGRFALVTDAMAAAGAGDGDHVLGPSVVRVRDGVARLVSNGAIAGSTLTMDRALRYAVTVAGVPLEAAVEAATATPARVLGIPDVGALEAGRRADLVHLDDDLEVVAVMRAGAWLEVS
ncbi:N-acetylglucosamine-6-phosphate deacetylase [Fodinibacter luteus]|uniref:N-acetylglucosamine-6-phosphate deacetylase n=1 Tax=Fodinibacter luteus TaxID=552064 RepID=A0ABP8KNJ9_9MICO